MCENRRPGTNITKAEINASYIGVKIMSNELNGVNNSLIQTTAGLSKSAEPVNLESQASKQGNEPSNSVPRDQLTLTASATKLQQLEKEIAALPVVDQQRVDSIKNAILNGEYRIDPVKTAEKFLQFEVSLAK